MNKYLYILKDTNNDRIISKHRTIVNAVNAENRLTKSIKKFGHTNYLPTIILNIDGSKLSREDHSQMMQEMDKLRYK